MKNETVPSLVFIDSTGAELLGMLTDLARTAAKDPTVPSLCTIRLHTANGWLHGWSTNKHIAAHATCKPAGGELPREVFVYATDVKPLASALKRSRELTVELDPDLGALTFTNEDRTFMALRLADVHQYPLLPQVTKNELPEASPAQFDGKYLMEFGAIAKRRNQHLTIVTNGDKPAHISIGDAYRAWLCAINLRSNGGIESVAWLPEAW